MKPCRYCGRDNDEQAAHCHECGTSFTRAIPQPLIASGAVEKLFLRISDKLRMPSDPSPLRRDEVMRFLAQRPALMHDEWHRRFAASRSIPPGFVRWFRDICSESFGYDLSAALPDDRLVADLGMFEATWHDVDTDIMEDYAVRFSAAIPEAEAEGITTFGEFLEALWSHAQASAPKENFA